MTIIKRSCNKCYGRGFLTYLIGDGYKVEKVPTPAGDLSVRVPNTERRLGPCACFKRQPIDSLVSFFRGGA